MNFVFEVYSSSLEHSYESQKVLAILKNRSSLTTLKDLKRYNVNLDSVESSDLNRIILDSITTEIEERSLPKRLLSRRRLLEGEDLVISVDLTPPVTHQRIETTQRASRIAVDWRHERSLDYLENVRRNLISTTLNKENSEFLNLLTNCPIINFKTENINQLTLEELRNLVNTGCLKLSGYRFRPEAVLIHSDTISLCPASVNTVYGIRIISDVSIPSDKAYVVSNPLEVGIFAERTPLMLESFRDVSTFSTNIAVWQDSAMCITNSNSVQIFQLVSE